MGGKKIDMPTGPMASVRAPSATLVALPRMFLGFSNRVNSGNNCMDIKFIGNFVTSIFAMSESLTFVFDTSANGTPKGPVLFRT